MNLQRILVPIGGIVLVAFAWRAYGWGGVALVVGGIVMWMLLHFTRMTQVLKRAADAPIGYVGSAVMLNARLRPGLPLLHVIGLTRSLGEQLSGKDEQPEIYRWTDPGAASVTCEFQDGRLLRWKMDRPPEEPAAPAQ
ncbi:MAG TPA: glycerate kinase [Ramlibacter sp.]|nr:glycerate kinase [Ramlibacter sp.]